MHWVRPPSPASPTGCTQNGLLSARAVPPYAGIFVLNVSDNEALAYGGGIGFAVGTVLLFIFLSRLILKIEGLDKFACTPLPAAPDTVSKLAPR